MGKKKFEELSFTIEVKMQIPFFLDKCQLFLKKVKFCVFIEVITL